ncbi:MAG: phage tail tape measure protein [Flavobacteriaceae bacterium]|nr:phage tail tape measure protein [Flavobacteriaceae bacterium]
MAKTISDEVMKFSIIVNGNEAQKELFELEKSTRKLNEENKALVLQRKVLEKQGQKDTQAYKDLNASIKANTAEITSNKDKMKVLQEQIGLTGLTMAQLQSKSTMLRNVLRNLIPGSADYQRYEAELQQVSNRMSQLRGNARETGLSLGSLADGFNRYQGIALSVIAALTGVVLSVQKIIDINGKLSDAQSDVMKTTGMTKVEVDELTKSFGLLHTRTSRIDLLGIAEIGGKLGILKSEIPAFVTVMNKAGVALSDSFTGGAEEAADKLGKIKGLYGELREAGVEITFEAVGSALNDLGAAGTASEANVADFVTRVGSMPEVFKPSIAQALGLGAAFEESGLNAEKAGGNYSKVITLAAKNVEGFAKQMGKPRQEIENLINSNPTEFFLQFANSLKGLSGTQLAEVLDKLKLNDNEVKQVLGAASQNTDLFRQKIDLANKSMNLGTSLTNEYNIKNTNLAAILERLSKTVSGWFSSETFVAWLTNAVTSLAEFIGAIEDVDGKTTAWKNTLVFTAKVIAVVVAAMVSNVAWLQLCALWKNRNTEANILYIIASKAKAFADGVAMVASQAYAAVTMLLTGNIVGATQAFRVMTATMMTTPWGFIFGAIAAVGTAYVLFSDNTKKAATAQDMLNDNMREADGVVQKQSASFMSLISIIQDKTASHEAQTAALKQAKKIGGEYVQGLTLENAATFAGKKLIDDYIKSLEKKAMLQVLEKRQSAIMEEMSKKKSMSLEEEVSWYDKAWASIKNLGNPSLAAGDVMIAASKRRTTALGELQKSLNLTNAEMKRFLEQNPDAIAQVGGEDTGAGLGAGGGSQNTGGTTSKSNKKSQAEINKEKLDGLQQYNETVLRFTRQLEDDKAAAITDGYEKELTIENLRYKREIEDLERQKTNANQLAQLDIDMAKAKADGDTQYYNFLFQSKKIATERNIDLTEQINNIEQGKLKIHNIKLATIQEKAATELLKKNKESFDQAKLLRETKYNEELAALGNNKRAKARLKKQFDANEIIEEEKFLNDLIDKFNQIVGKGKFEGIDLSLLTPEQVEQFTQEAAKVGLTLAQLIAKKNELAGKDTGTDFGLLQGAGTDIFGFSPEQWTNVFENFDTLEGKIDAVQTVFGGLQNAWSLYSSFVDANSRKELAALDKKQSTERIKLKRQLDLKQISQEQYDKKVAKLDDIKEKSQAEADYKRAKNERIAALLSIATSTGVGIMKAVAASPLTGGMPWTAIIGGLGLLQAALVLKTPLPAKGYEDGLYPEYVKREQDGKMFKSKPAGKTRSGLVSNTSHFLVAESGPEMVIDNKAWTRMNPAVKDALIRDLQGIKGWENGYYNESLKRYEVPSGSSSTPTPSSNSDSDLLRMVLMVLQESNEVMKDLRDNGVEGKFYKGDLKSAKNIKDSINDYEKLRSNSKF